MRRPHPVLDRLREVSGISSDTVLAETLGLHPQTPRDCRRNGHVPYAAIVTAVRAGVLGDVDLHFVFTGHRPGVRHAKVCH